MTPTVETHPDLVALQALYERTEREFYESLPLEHFMESVPHAHQRKITLESFDVIHARRPDIQCFSELLIQYPRPGYGPENPAQVVPDNMVVVHAEPIVAVGNFGTPFQPVGPTLVLEYVSKSSREKDYEDNYVKYEQYLKVPYYLVFDPEVVDLAVYRLVDDRYQTVQQNQHGRLAIPELEVEVAILGDWLRYWFRGELVPLTADLLHERDVAQRQLEVERRSRLAAEADAARKLEAERQSRLAAEAEAARLREELDRLRAGK
jgi:Uma2 family endonuclease